MLDRIKKGVEVRPELALIYSDNGHGKTTLASSAEAPLFIDMEKGASFVGADRVEPESMAEVIETLEQLAEGGHDYRTAVLDSLDELERLASDEVLRRENWTAAQFDAYGRGVKIMTSDLDQIWRLIERVRASGMHVIMLAHASLRKEREADADEEADRWGLRCTPSVANMFRGRFDEVWFLRREMQTITTESKRKKAVLTGRTLLYTKPSSAWFAKTRLPRLDGEIVIPPSDGWLPVRAALDEARAEPDAEAVEAALVKLGPKARAWLSTQTNKAEAARVVLERAEQIDG